MTTRSTGPKYRNACLVRIDPTAQKTVAMTEAATPKLPFVARNLDILRIRSNPQPLQTEAFVVDEDEAAMASPVLQTAAPSRKRSLIKKPCTSGPWFGVVIKKLNVVRNIR